MARPKRQTQANQSSQVSNLPPDQWGTSQDFNNMITLGTKGEATSESEYSDYEKKSKRRTSIRDTSDRPAKKHKASRTKRTFRKCRPAAAALPEMSDLEDDIDDGREFQLFENPAHSPTELRRKSVALVGAPKTVQLEIPLGLTTVHLDLASLVQQGLKATSRTFSVRDEVDDTLVTRCQDVDLSNDTRCVSQKRQAAIGFLDLGPELRNRIYRYILVSKDPVKFTASDDLPRTAALLRVSRQINVEARGILYGENAFHLTRRNATRGAYFEARWKEVGYKDIRRLLETIGSHNIALIRYLSIKFEDVPAAFASRTHQGGSKYVTDPVVHRICDLIAGSKVILEKFAVAFIGKAQLDKDDYHFLRSFTRIRCRQLIETCAFGHSKVSRGLNDKLRETMVVKRGIDVDAKKIKSAPRMYHEYSNHQCYWQRCTERSIND